ncbi:MAG: DNA-binding response regulator [Clostridiales bacterium]|nr:MAG: DNA-binding response regulator [Clostridiales bacterium]
MNKPLILVVEDDSAIRNLISTTLETHDYKYHTAPNGEAAILEAVSNKPDVLLLDLGLPDIDGVEIIKKIRTWSTMPIIVISARSEDHDKIEALDAGADDYITKPFSVEELLARLRVALRRLTYSQSAEGMKSSVFNNGELKIDYSSGCVYISDDELHLTPIEYKLICLLAKNVGKVLTYTFITREIWGSAWENDVASLRVFMATLRKKIEKDTSCPQYIQTHVGIGYRMLRV